MKISLLPYQCFMHIHRILCHLYGKIEVTGKASRTFSQDQEVGVSDTKAIVTFAICLGI